MDEYGKIYIVILCGAADRSCVILDGKTPLDVANTPTLDMLTANGRLGSIRIIDDEVPPESDSGAMALLSYDPFEYYTGRGPLEGLGLGFNKLGTHSVSFRVNFASIDSKSGTLDRRTARDLTDSELQRLAQSLREHVDTAGWGDVDFDLMAFGQHRGVLCFYSDTVPLSGNVANTDPGFTRKGPFGIPVKHDNKPVKCQPLDDTIAARNTASLINWFVETSASVLREHPVNTHRVANQKLPANLLLFRDGGDHPKPIPCFTTRFRRSVVFYGQIPAEKGLMELIGGRFVAARRKDGENTGTYHAELAQNMLADTADIVMVHLKGVDEHGHDGSATGKVSGLEMLDREFLSVLVSGASKRDTVVVVCDHATPCELKLHSADKVPVLIHGPHVSADGTDKFSEAQSVRGGLQISHACELLDKILSFEKARHDI